MTEKRGFWGVPGAPGQSSCTQQGHRSYLVHNLKGMRRQVGEASLDILPGYLQHMELTPEKKEYPLSFP